MRKMRKSLSLLLAMLMLTSMMPIGTVSLFDVPAVKAEAAETTIAPPDGDTTEDTESTYTWAFDAATGTLTIGGTGVVNVELAKELESEESGNETDTDTGTGTDAETTEVPDIASMLPWGENIKDIKHVVVEEGITGLGDGSLSYLINMESISLPSTLVTVGKGAFCYALSLKKLIIPEGVTSIDEGAFSTLTSLETLILPDSLQVCKDDFSEICSYSLTNVTLPACIESFDSSYSMYIENLYNKSLTVAVDFSVFDEGYEIIFTEEYRYFLQLYNELLLKKSVEEGLFGTVADENALQQEFISKFNARFGTSYTIDSMNDLFDDPDSLTPLTINRTIYCYENSAQHTVCTKHYDKHILYGTDTEHTSCFTLSGTSTDDNSNSFTWTVDITARTLTINGTGEMEFASYSNLPGWYNVSKFYDTVNIGEGITSFEGEYVFSSIENLNLPATYTNTSIAESIFYCKKVKNVNVAEGNTTILSIDGVVYVQLSEEELAEFKSEYGTDSTGDLFLVYYPSGRSYFSISDRTFSVLFLGCYNYLNEITIPDTVAYLLLSLYSNSLKKVNIPSSVKALVVETSELASSLEEINVDSDNTVYASKDGILFSKDFSTLYVYPAAKDLSELVLPESVTKIARDAINNYRGYSFLSDVKILNKECVIESNAILEDITIHGIPESTAQTYATENGNKFVSIEEKEIAGVAVKTMPNITEFMQGKSFVSDGLTLTVTYTDGTTSDRTAGFTVSGFDSSKLGTCTLTVDYSGYATCTFDVTIIEYVEPVLTEGTQLTVYVDGDGVEYVKFVPAKTAEYKFTYSSTADGNYSVSLYNANKEYYDYLGSSVSLTADTTYYVYLHNYNNSAIPFTLSVAESHYHSYTKTLTKEATCAEAGLYTYTCSCGESYTEEIALLPHADDNEDFVCDTCDAEIKILYEGTCGDTMTWKIYSSGLMLIEGSGEMTSYPWSSYRNKITKVRMADEITSITSNAFYNCTNLVDVKLPSGLVSIDSYAFERCLNLKSIELPAGVTSIGYGAFSRCSSLSAINLPSSVTSIGETAFGDCTSLTAINVDSENTAYSSNNGVLYNKEGTVLVQCPGALTTVEILTTTKEIGSYAFSDGKITAVTLPELVTNIDSNAFAYCSDLTSVVLSDNLTTIGDDAFRDCEALTKITIPESVTDIGERAFYSCGKLDDFNIPSSIRYIDENAFSGTAFYYNSNNWDNGALYSDCCLIATNSSLPTDYTIKENTLFICKGALSGQSEIENLTIPFVGSRAVTEADEYQYPFGYIFGDNYSGSNSDYYQFNQDYDKGNMYSYVPKSLKNVTVTSGVITTGAFDDCESLTISLSDNVTKVCDKAFDCYECTVKFYGRNTEIYGSSTAVDASLIFAYEASTAHVYAETYRVSYKLFDINQKKVVSAKLVNSLPLQKYSSEYALYYDALLLMFEVVFDDSTTSTLSLASLAASHNFDFDIIDLSDNEKILRITNGTITININVEFCEVTEVSELEINSLYTNLYGKYCTFVPEVSGTYYVYSKAYLYTEKVTSDMEEYQIEDKLSPQSYVSYGKEPLYNYFFYSSSDGLSAEYPFHNEFTLEAGHEYGILVFSEQFIISDHELTSENSETKTYNDCYLGTVTETTLEYGYTIKESSSNSGEHVWSDFETLIEPTDNSCGLKKAVCERCGLVGYAVWETSSCSHEWTTTEVISEPTCSTAGEHKSTCLVCGDETTETDYAIGHIAGEVKSYDEPKCTTNGTVVSICQKCGVEYSRDIYSRGHNYSTEWTVDSEATCTTDGSKSHHCTKCNEKSDVTVIPATGHSYGDFVTATEPTCTKTGLKKKTCSACGDVVTETIDALGHDFSTEWTIDKAATCTKDGSKSHHCTRCNEKSDVTVIPALGHDFSTEWTIDKAATCTKDGSKSHHCSRCSGKSDVTVISATGHSYGDFVTVTEPTCTKTGLKKKTCSACGDVVTENIDVLTADGHSYSDYTTLTEPTCTLKGLKQKVCSVCGDIVKEEIPALGHDFPEYTRTKEPTVLCEGEEQSTCTRCGHVDTIILPAIQIDIDSNTNYGLANFTVVNAQTKEPIKNAKIYIYTEENGENEFSTDENGKVSIVLPVGKQQISAYADGCLTRNLKINVKSGINDIPLIGLSNMKTYDAEVTQHPMTKEEIEEAGIDMEDPENNHVFKYELNLVFVPEVDWLSISYYMDDFGNIWPGGGNGSGSGSGGGGYGSGGGWVSSGSGSGKGTYYRYVDSDGGVKEIYPVSEYFYLIISGEVRWLKEMFDVEMLVINNSQTDTLENLNATLNLPEGLSLAAMKGDEQSLSVDLDNVPEGGTSSVHWYVRGDTAGTYPIEATLTGMVMPFEEEISDTFKAEKAIEVWAGNALHLDFEVPGAAYYGEDYNVKITLTNVSDITLYNVSSFVTNIKQSRVTHYSDGSVEEEIYMDKDVNIGDFAAEFKPGDKIVIELSINILFKSKLMEYKLNKLIGYVDGIEKLIKSYKAIKTGLDIGSALIKGIGKASKALDTFISSAALATDKLNATKALKEAVADFSLKYSKSESKTLDASVKLANSSVGVMFNAFTANPDEWLKNSSVNDIQKLTGGIKTLGNSISSTDSSTKSFNVFDSIRTLISAIPVVFTLQEYFLVEDEDNTTSIPYSVSVLPNTPHYFGVSNLGRHLSNILTVAARDFIKDSLPSYFLLLPGVNNELSTEDAKREIAVVENEIAQFKAKSATGDVKYKAYIVRNEEQTKAKMLRAAANTATNGFELSSDAEDAVIENGVLTFTGDAIINVKPLSTQGGTLVVEADDGTKYEYDLNVVEQHECDEDDYEVIISPTADYDGFAVKCCSVCEDVMDVVILSSSDCEHTFGAWTNEITPTCNECGLRSHSCSKCGFEESEILDIDTTAHVVSDWVIDTDSTCAAVGSKHTYCTVCKETIETQEIAKKAHTVSDWVIDTDSTCAAVGSKHTYCTVCKETIETQEIAKKAHTVSDWIVINAPSCTSNGKQIKKCTVCNTEIESKTISATGHTMTAWTTTKAPTCTESGVRTRTCTVCKKTESAGISATGHSDSNNDGTCDNCGADLGTKDPSANCSCKCHKTKGIQKFFWKILNFFNKIFKKNQFCDCGAKHW